MVAALPTDYDTWKTTPPVTHYTDEEAEELAEVYAADAVIQRLEKMIEDRKFHLRVNWEDACERSR